MGTDPEPKAGKMRRFRLALNVFTYVSFAIAVYVCYRIDFLAFSELEMDPVWLVAAAGGGIAAAFLLAACWWFLLGIHGMPVTYGVSALSFGLSVFTKYLPGKIWTVLGRSAFITPFGYGFKRVSYVSLQHQLMHIWSGAVVCVVPLWYFYGPGPASFTVSGIIVAYTVFICSRGALETVSRLLSAVVRRPVNLPHIGIRGLIRAGAFYVSFWGVWSAGYWAFCRAFVPGLPAVAAVALPISVLLGLVAFFLPVGIGVRESVMAGILALTGVPLRIGAAVAVVARLYVLFGDMVLFIAALAFKPRTVIPDAGPAADDGGTV